MSSQIADDDGDGVADQKVRLCLFVAGDSARATVARRSLESLIGSSLPADTELEVIDVLRHPEAAEEYRILATPLVIKLAPAPQRRVVGDLADLPRLADALGVDRMRRSNHERPHR